MIGNSDERDDPDDDGDPGGRVGPLVRLAADEAERETADRERRDERAEPVEARGRLGVASTPPRGVTVAHRANGEQRDVDQEREPPADRVDHDPADDRPETVSAEVEAAQMPNARPRAAPSKAWVMSASEPGTSSAPAAPWRSRKTTSNSSVGASPHSAEVSANPARPMRDRRGAGRSGRTGRRRG